MSACNVPVFRYALEHWQPDPYEVVIFHRGPLDPADQAAVQILQRYVSGNPKTNITLEVIDLEKKPELVMVRLFQAQPKAELPWMVLRYPAVARIEQPAWTGKLSLPAVDQMLNSPVRFVLARQLQGGETAVWVLLECGQKEKDTAAAMLLQEEILKLPSTLKLPELTSTREDQLARDGPPLRISFSMLRIARDDPAEQLLIQTLVHSEEDLPDRMEPMVFPVFGRGRSLLAYIGAGITPDNIKEGAAFLVGPCSCLAKRLNPGFDLLVAADWESALDGRMVPPPAPVAGAGESVPIPQTTPRSAPDIGQDEAAPSALQPGWARRLLFAGLAAAAVLAALTGARTLRKKGGRTLF